MLTHVARTLSVVLYLVVQTVVLYAAATVWVTGGTPRHDFRDTYWSNRWPISAGAQRLRTPSHHQRRQRVRPGYIRRFPRGSRPVGREPLRN